LPIKDLFFLAKVEARANLSYLSPSFYRNVTALMRKISLLFSFSVCALLLWSLSRPWSLGDKQIPPLGNFFNPFSGFWANAEPSGPPRFSNVSLPGLKGKVEVVYDDLLVPHIFAENIEDAAKVQGYVTAQHRLWQMDITVRKASGRLSEVLGERTLRLDRLARRRGMVLAAENDLVTWKKSKVTMDILNAYTEGVNEWIAQMGAEDLPIEFKLIGYRPEPWSVFKSALVTEAMAETLCAWDDDLENTNAFALLGAQAFEDLYPEWNPKQQPVVPDTGQWKNLAPLLPPPFVASATNTSGYGTLHEPQQSSRQTPYGTDGPIIGSNNWAVAGSKTRSGKPILCNDPHLDLTLPSIWYQVQIHTPEANTYGVSLPGVPGVVIGFNENVAWGVTNVSHDVSDWYNIHWTDASRTAYKLDGEEKSVQFRYEEIKVKGQKALIDTVRYTVFGPVTYDFEADNPLRNCALRWVAHDVPEKSAVEVFLGLNMAKGYEDYRAALPGFDAPAQNFVFASRTGDIAIQVQGKYPVRGRQQGRFIQEGDRWANAWHQFVPWEWVPNMKNPSRGYVFSANQHSTPPSYPYYYLGNFEDWRSRRIGDRLTEMTGISVEDMKALQLDNFSQRAADAVPTMLALLDRSQLDADGKQIADEIGQWNFSYDLDKLAPTLFEVWFDSCYAATWDEIRSLENGNHRPSSTDDLNRVKNLKTAIAYPEAWRLVEMLQNEPAHAFFDHPGTPFKETARDIVLESFKQMQSYFKQNPEQRKAYGEVKGFALRHLGQIDAFSRLDVKVGGHRTAPNAISKTNGPSWRMVVELGDPVRAWGVYPGGQSGNPGSPFYDNMVASWSNGDYYELLFLNSPEAVPGKLIGKQTFSPK
jgi:penicillin amidase